MSPAWRRWLFLGGSLVAFAGMAALVVGGVTATRRDRDLRFGMEELDSLLAAARGSVADDPEAALAEAASMAPWLAGRARTSSQAREVLRRALEIADLSSSYEALNRSATILLDEFPGNELVRTIGVYAAVRAGAPDVALERAALLADSRPSFYAWALLSAGETAHGGGDGLLLASLARDAPAADFERAWRLTGDARYALDAALLHLAEGDGAEAERLATEAALTRHAPRFTADLMQDRGRYDDALAALERADPTGLDGVPSSPRTADLLLLTGRLDEARDRYRRLREGPDPHPLAYVNAAALADSREEAARLVDEGKERFPESWELAQAGALLGRPLGSWDGTPHEGRARLLRLRLDPNPDRRGFAAELWTVVRTYPDVLTGPDGAGAFAAWYFASRGRSEDLELLLDSVDAARPADAAPPAWTELYRGIAEARARRWPAALERFESSFRRSPAWEAAFNAAIANLRLGRAAEARARLQDAVLLARAGDGRSRAAVFVAAARLAGSRNEQRALVDDALAIAPDSAEVLLLATQLDMVRGR